MTQTITIKALEDQNRRYACTKKGREGHRLLGLVPGFIDRATGTVYRSCKSDGSPAKMHSLDGLPDKLVVARAPSGQVAAVKGSVIPGFILDGCFYTHNQVIHALD